MTKLFRFLGAASLIASMAFLVTAAGSAQSEAVAANQGCKTWVNGYTRTSYTECR